MWLAEKLFASGTHNIEGRFGHKDSESVFMIFLFNIVAGCRQFFSNGAHNFLPWKHNTGDTGTWSDECTASGHTASNAPDLFQSRKRLCF